MVQAVMRVMGSDGGRQMKLRSLARRSPPTVRPGSQQAADLGAGVPCCRVHSEEPWARNASGLARRPTLVLGKTAAFSLYSLCSDCRGAPLWVEP